MGDLGVAVCDEREVGQLRPSEAPWLCWRLLTFEARMELCRRKGAPGKPTTRRYSSEEKTAAVRMVRTLRAELGVAFGYRLRALLRFFFIAGITVHDLSAATLVIRSPQPSRLPVGATRDEVAALLTGCDRDTRVGLRDYAVLVLLARLGLRTIEVARLRLDDIDWHRGEILVRGKGNRDERLPLPHEVDDALVGYLRNARPADAGLREVFAAGRAPRRPLTREAVGGIVEHGCDRAGLERLGAHRLRHTLGAQMVTAAVPLDAIGQVLRHTT